MLAAGATAVVAPVRARRRHALAIVAARAQRATALAALSRLLMDSDPLDVPFYEAVNQAQWFKWSSIHAAAVVFLF
ncbi:hypothetical protein ZWY2020_035590 [Hordeum vulgare]|nr:hypothetical protein ZWY2020_035590 [Hordeum vulgare]